MVKLFRFLRQKMLRENRLGKYVTYATGEIFLVMIGILLALQVNNWNEQKKAEKNEIKILHEILNNLKIDLTEIQEDLTLMDEINIACTRFPDFVNQHQEVEDSIGYYSAILRVSPHFFPNKSGYGLLQSKGIEIISNDSLRMSISVMYELSYPYYKTYEEERSRFLVMHVEPVLINYFSMKFKDGLPFGYRGTSFFEIQDTDYQRLKDNHQIKKLVSAVEFENRMIQNRAKSLETNIKNLIADVESELKILE